VLLTHERPSPQRPLLLFHGRMRTLPHPHCSAWSGRRTIAAERAGSHAKTGSQGRRYAMQRRAAITAVIFGSAIGAEPMPAGAAFRIDTLHRPSRQILHDIPPGPQHRASRVRRIIGGILCEAACVVKKKYTICSGHLAGLDGSVRFRSAQIPVPSEIKCLVWLSGRHRTRKPCGSPRF
jgi:hypothetical protein